MNETARILVVDDDPSNLHLTTHVLKSAGYGVDEAPTAGRAWELVKANKPDLVLLDVVLPDVSGLDLCKRIKADPDLVGSYVLMISGMKTESDSQAEGLEVGADGYIVRPMPGRELLARVQAMLRIREAEQGLRRSKEQVVRILESISDGFFALDGSFVVTYFNEAAGRLLHRKNEDVVGRNFIAAFPEAEGTTFEHRYRRALETKAPDSFEAYFEAMPYRG